MNVIYKAWRIAVRRVWKVPWRTHNDILPHLTGVLPPELSFAKRAIGFIKLLLKSENKTVQMITGMGLYGKHSILGANTRHLSFKYCLDCKFVDREWERLSAGQDDLVRVSEQIKELCWMRDTCNTGNLTRSEVINIIDMLCTE